MLDLKAEVDEFADDWGLDDYQAKYLELFAHSVRAEAVERACKAVVACTSAGFGYELAEVIRRAFADDAKPADAGEAEPSAREQFDKAAVELREYLGMGSLDMAAKFGPDFDPDEYAKGLAERFDSAARTLNIEGATQ